MQCSFIPPYLLSRLASNDGDRPSATSGQHTLRLDDQLRSLRDARPQTMRPTPAVGQGKRVVHDAKETEQLPGEAVRADGEPATGDEAVDDAFDSSGEVWSLFADEFDRSSVDGLGTPLSITVHFGQDYDNAFWDGEQLVFGDGDGEIFVSFTEPMDVMAHEFTHGVTQFTAGLAYQGQSGALNESVSDVFAAMAKQRSLDQTADEASWLIGEGIFRPGVKARALRSMIEPGTAYDDPELGADPQVGSMADYVETDEDSGGVHLNSGIPNRAFALAARKVGGRSWQQTGRVWYDAITSGEVSAHTDFAAFARATLASAGRLFPGDARVATHVRSAWEEVGVLTAESPSAPVAGTSTPARRVAVRRSGGFANVVRAGELDLDSDPDGPEVRDLLSGLDLQSFGTGAGAPDRFVYTLEFGPDRVTVLERELTPELQRVVQLVLGPRGGALGSS